MTTETKQALGGTLIAILIASGLAWAGSQNGYSYSGIPVFAVCVAVAFAIQWIAFIPSFIKRTEKFYDLTGGFANITVIITAVLLTPSVDTRSLLLAYIIAVWAIRLSSFLFLRIHTTGEDRRFREIKRSFSRFLLAWTLQGLWISFSLATALAAITSTAKVDLDTFAFVGFLVFVFGFTMEVVADRQKKAFNANPKNKGKFISTGLWAWSRHPNYFGEIVLWIGITVIALPVLQGWQWVTLISPVFVYILLTRISGINLLETRADEKWGGQEEYEVYKSGTPLLIPKPPSNRK